MSWPSSRIREQLEAQVSEQSSDCTAAAWPDDTSLALAAQHDPTAFDALYSRYVGPIYRYCHVRLGTREAAEDATSATFLKAMHALPRYREGNFAGWLYRIAANTVVDLQRERGRYHDPSHSHVFPERRDPAPLPDEQAIERAREDELRAALARLPDEQRAAVELQLAGWSGQQIADALGRSPEAVRMLRHRALTRLRTILADSDDTSCQPTTPRRPR